MYLSYRAKHVQVCGAPILAVPGRRHGADQIGSLAGSSPGAVFHNHAQDGSVRGSSPAVTTAVTSRTSRLTEAGPGAHDRRAAQDCFLTDPSSSSARRADVPLHH